MRSQKQKQKKSDRRLFENPEAEPGAKFKNASLGVV